MKIAWALIVAIVALFAIQKLQVHEQNVALAAAANPAWLVQARTSAIEESQRLTIFPYWEVESVSYPATSNEEVFSLDIVSSDLKERQHLIILKNNPNVCLYRGLRPKNRIAFNPISYKASLAMIPFTAASFIKPVPIYTGSSIPCKRDAVLFSFAIYCSQVTLFIYANANSTDEKNLNAYCLDSACNRLRCKYLY